MPQISRSFFLAAAVFLIVGVAIGLQMSISGVHKVAGAHAHVSLLGWVSLALFGTYFALDPDRAASRLAMPLYWLSVASVAVMCGALYLVLLGSTAFVPVLVIGSIGFAVAAALFCWIVFAPAAHHEVTGHGRAAH